MVIRPSDYVARSLLLKYAMNIINKECKIEMTPGEAEAVRIDDPAAFFMHFTIAGHVFGEEWIEALVTLRGWRILIGAVREYYRFKECIDLQKFAIQCCKDNRIPDGVATHLIEAIDYLAPDTVASAQDEEGRGAFECSMLREKPARGLSFDPKEWYWTVVPKLQSTLLEHGCKNPALV